MSAPKRLSTALALCATLVACGTPEGRPDTTALTLANATRAERAANLPPMKRFKGTTPAPAPAALRSNAEMSRDFLDLFFQLETGAELPVFTRFEGPITLRVTGGPVPASLSADLGDLLTRLRNEAGLSITRVSSAEAAAITIELIDPDDLARRARDSACIAVADVSSWREFSSRPTVSWTRITTRTRAAIFIPRGVAPQELRDCLHEELAQTLGPLNDLYRLTDSTFNDDNVHSVLTGFDMLMLRAAYAPELRSGMDRATVSALIGPLLDRLNPRGRTGGTSATRPTPPAFSTAIKGAIERGSTARRLAAANRAVAIAREQGWRDGRAGLAYFLRGRILLPSDQDAALTALLTARDLYDGSALTRYHAANVALPLAALALRRGEFDTVIALTSTAIPAATQAQNAALLSSLMFAKAEALTRMGRASEARAVRLDSLGWARYGFGTTRAVRDREAEFTDLARASQNTN
ncbi:DUF2927 domain-containing protein [Celeribacter sp.]|uniref:DUF2927 domain-containing protein n=1 Tax=Celeribacter sp. TaxID=1890673 RepID=UPI003A902ABB